MGSDEKKEVYQAEEILKQVDLSILNPHLIHLSPPKLKLTRKYE